MKPKQQLPKTTYRGNVLTFLAVITLTGVFLSPLVTGPGMHDGLRMGKAFFFVQWILLVIPVGVVVFIREWKQPVGSLSLLALLWFGWIAIRGRTGGIWFARAIQEIPEVMEQIISTHKNMRAIYKRKGDNYTYLGTFGFKLQFW